VITEFDKVYTAGFFDGDGCVSILKHNRDGASTIYSLHVSIRQKRRTHLDKLREKWDFLGSIHENRYKYRTYEWVIRSAKAEKFLRSILPYAQIKKDQIEIALEFRETFPHHKGQGKRLDDETLKRRENYYQLLQQMKK